jgi:hypothetical protein
MIRNPRHQDYTEAEKSTRKQRAEESAIINSDLGGPSTLADKWSRSSRQPRPLTLSEPMSQNVDLAILSVKSNYHNMTSYITDTSRTTSKTIPLLEVQPTTTKKRGVRRGRSKQKTADRPPARYWRPKGGLGGKSQSSKWGYGVGMPVKGH